MSASAERNLGWEASQLAGMNMFDLVHPEDMDTATKGLAKALSAPRANATVTVRLRDAAGKWRWMEGSATNLLDVPAVAGIVINFRDVTARRQLEEQLRQAQKMEATGLLAGGIAHDFNNLLGVVLGATELARRAARHGRPVDAMLAEVEEAAKRAAELTRNLLAFSRKQVLHVKSIDLGEAIEDFLGLLRRIIGEDVELEVLRCPEQLVVKADVSQLEQVLLNLSTNARQAMPSGGRFSIELARARFDDAYVSDHPWAAPGDYAELTVSDTGVGMDAETQARAAEPFFTTKASGTGLGLAMVHGIVHQHGGLLCVQSEVGKGTRVSVFFPLMHAEVDEASAARPQARSWPPRGHETLLVAEDEPTLRRMLATTLGDLGYRVMVAADGDEAARVLAGSHADISLAILDVVMPKLGGVEAYARMRAISPGLKVIFTTGHAPDGAAVSDIVARGRHALLHKPFRLDDLGRLVRETLDAHV
jgi:PAS domain S-box-containing protein